MRRTSVMAWCAAAAVSAWSAAALAGDWANAGGNPARNGLSGSVGPASGQALWEVQEGSDLSLGQPFIAGQRVFFVKQAPGASDPRPVAARDIATGAVLWQVTVPNAPNVVEHRLLGVGAGNVYYEHGFPPPSDDMEVVALDQASGATVWSTTITMDFVTQPTGLITPEGDLLVRSGCERVRLDHATGQVAWHVGKFCQPASRLAMHKKDLYAFSSGVLERIDASTGAVVYSTPLPGIPDSPDQSTLVTAPDGTLYLRAAVGPSDPAPFYAIQDTGQGFSVKWQTTAHLIGETAVGPDGSVYVGRPGPVLAKLDPATGNELKKTAPLLNDDLIIPYIAVDSKGSVFFSDGASELFACDADLNVQWTHELMYASGGGVALASDGTLVALAWFNMAAFQGQGEGMAGSGGTGGAGGQSGTGGAGGQSGTGGAGGQGGSAGHGEGGSTGQGGSCNDGGHHEGDCGHNGCNAAPSSTAKDGAWLPVLALGLSALLRRRRRA